MVSEFPEFPRFLRARPRVLKISKKYVMFLVLNEVHFWEFVMFGICCENWVKVSRR